MERTHSILNFAATVGTAAISIIATIVLILNIFSGIVGGIWLAILGHWGSIGFGFGLGFAMPWIYFLVSRPAMGLGFIVAFFVERRSKTFISILGFLTALYNNALLASWVFGVYIFFMNRANAQSYIPYLLWSYSTMMAPLSYMASKEPPDNFGTTVGLFYSQICYFIFVLSFFFRGNFTLWLYTIISTGIAFSLFVIVLIIAQMIEEERAKKARLAYESPENLYEDDNGYDKDFNHNNCTTN